MGDYTKLIVNCDVKGLSIKQLNAAIDELGPSTSAYHCGAGVRMIEKASCSMGELELTLVCQTKYSRGQKEFLDFLLPHVAQGSGSGNIWAIQIYESGTPIIYQMSQEKCEYCGHVESSHMLGCPMSPKKVYGET